MEVAVTDAYRSNRIRGKSILWTWTDGPTKGMTHEHVFHPEGTVVWREIDKDSRSPSDEASTKAGPPRQKVEYAALEAGVDVCAVSYLAPSGFTLTVVLNFRTHTLVGFVSGANEWYPVRGTFEVVE
jgi:hypothetical protein